nr:hypothetical protein [Eubacteriales bacterium]
MEKCVLNVFETVNYGVNCREAVERYDMEVNHIHAPDRSGDKRRQKVEMFFNFVDEVEIPVPAEPMIAESTLGRRKTA